MGTTYDLVKFDWGVTFDLGKGNWQEVFLTPMLTYYGTPFILGTMYETPSDLAESILTMIDKGYWDLGSEKEKILYVSNLANRLFEWCGWDRIMISSNSDHLDWRNFDPFLQKFRPRIYTRELTFKETGNRYERRLPLD